MTGNGACQELDTAHFRHPVIGYQQIELHILAAIKRGVGVSEYFNYQRFPPQA